MIKLDDLIILLFSSNSFKKCEAENVD